MPPSRKRNSSSNPGPSSEGSQHRKQSRSTYKQSKRPARKSQHAHGDTTLQTLGVDITALHTSAYIPRAPEIPQHNPVATGLTHISPSPYIPNNIPWAPGIPQYNPFNPASTQGHNTFPNITEPLTFPVAAQFQGAQGLNINGQPRFTNIGMNTGNMTTVNNYGGTHGLEKMENFVSFAALHDSAEQDPTRRCHPGTRRNVLSQLGDWIGNPNTTHRISWLHGPAGAGKSAIAQTIAHEYKERGVAGTFFFYRSDAERSDGNRLFPTLAWQLAFSIPAIKDFIVHALDKTPHLPRKDIESQFEQLVAYPFHPTNNIASHLPQPAPVVIIDGVDECSDEGLQRRILNVIGNAVKDDLVPLHFLICSRPEALIEEVFDQFKNITFRIDLAALDDSNRDIEKYLIDQFSVIASKRDLDPSWPNPETIEEFVFKSSGNFIFAATVMRYIGDEDCDPEEQLDIVRNLKPCGKISPFALLDELYLEILKRQRDQDFLKAFLALLVGRTSITIRDLQEDDATLMNVSEKNLCLKLRRMRSLLKFEPFIDVYHRSFLDFLQDSFRSSHYHVSKQGGQKQYLELIVDRVVQHISTAIEQPKIHEECRSSPQFKSIVIDYPVEIKLPVEDWQEALKPLLCLQDRLLNTCQPRLCRITQVMRELLLHLVILQRKSQPIATAQAPESNMNETPTQRSITLATEARKGLPENDLDRCLSELLSCLQNTNSALVVDTVIIERMSSLLVFDYVEIATRVRSVTDAQTLIDMIDLLINNETFFSQCGRDAARKAALLVSEIYQRAPLLPRSVFLNGPTQQCDWLYETETGDLQYACQSMVISRILDHDRILPTWCIYQGDEPKFVVGNANEQNEPVHKWLERSKPNFVTRIRVMLEVAKTIQYIHSMDVVAALNSDVIESDAIALDSNLHPKIYFLGYFAWQFKENLIFKDEVAVAEEFTPEHNITAFSKLFDEMCFDDDDENDPNNLVEDVRQLIERCGTEDPKSRPSMENVVKEMETWDLTYTV